MAHGAICVINSASADESVNRFTSVVKLSSHKKIKKTMMSMMDFLLNCLFSL